MGGKLAVVGAGPAGVSAAANLARLGYDVVVYEAAARPGLKPCGYGVPSLGDLPVRLPKDTVLVRIRGARLLVDGVEAATIRGELEGVILDKPATLEAILAEAGVEYYYRARYDPSRRIVRVGGRVVDVREPVLLAGGWPYYDGEKIAAVQVEARARGLEWDMLEVHFDTRLVGYYWIFPRSDTHVDVGVGGYADFNTLKSLLHKFLDSDPRLSSPRGSVRGALIAVGGLRLRAWKGHVLAGEAAGFVLPLTGEGIRPSMISGKAAGEALVQGRDPVKAQESLPIARAVTVQRRILEKVKSMEPARRAELLRGIPAEVHVEVALGRLDRGRILRALAARPRLALRLLRLLSI